MPPLAALHHQVRVARGTPSQGYPATRQQYLDKQLTAIDMVVRMLQGDVVYRDEVAACFDIDIAMEPESTLPRQLPSWKRSFQAVHCCWNERTRGRDQYIVDNATARAGFDLILNETRIARSISSDLRAGEDGACLVVDKPWSGYNWYLGNAKSLVEINVDLPPRANAMTDLTRSRRLSRLPSHPSIPSRTAQSLSARGWR
ncbi:MAG: hypothetical protein R2855_06305 [Thermomicrobiales bacterium]